MLVRALWAPLVLAFLLVGLTGSAGAAPPPNDGFANATALSGDLTVAPGTTIEASKEVGEPDHAGVAGGKSVWFRWLASRSGEVRVGCQSGFDTVFAIYRGSTVGSLSEVASNRHFCEYPSARFRAAAGSQYWIAVDGAGGSSGSFELELENSSARPPDDDFANATPVSNWSSLTVTTEGASREPGEPLHGGAATGSSVWIRWTAQRTGLTSIYPCKGSFHPIVEAFLGSSVNGLTAVGTVGNPGAGDTTCVLGGLGGVTFPAVSGQTYAIAIDGTDGAWGSASFAIQEPRSPFYGPVAHINPKIRIRRGRATIRFSSPETVSGYVCQIDSRAPVPCTSPKTYSRLSLGAHLFSVTALGDPGSITNRAAVRHFKIRKPEARRR